MVDFFAENLSFLISQNRTSIAELAEKLALDRSTIRYWADGNMEPRLEELLALSEVLGISCDRLLRIPLAKVPDSGKIKMLVLDVDGVLTDGGMYFTEAGDEIKKFNTKDGRGIMSAGKAEIEVCFLSSGVQEKAIAARAERLGVKTWYVGLRKKGEVLGEWMAERGLDYQAVAYIGDDVNDLAILQSAGLAACPSDAVQKVRDAAHIILKAKGGEGCVRELVEDYLGIEVG